MRALADLAEKRLREVRIRRVAGEPALFMRALAVRSDDAPGLWSRLYDEFGVEAPEYQWEGRAILRVWIGPYTDEDDIERLVEALHVLRMRG